MAKGFIEQYCLEKNLLPLPAYICDNAHGLWGSNIAGVDIVSPERLKDESVDEVVIVMAQVLPFTMLDELQSTHEVGGLQRYYHLVLPLSQLEAYLFYQIKICVSKIFSIPNGGQFNIPHHFYSELLLGK